MKNQSLMWRWLVLIGLCALSIWRAYPLKEKLPLGIDLQGGYRFVLDIDYEQMRDLDGNEPSPRQREEAQNKALVVLRNRLDSTGTKEATVYKEEGGQIVFEIPGGPQKTTSADPGEGEDAEEAGEAAAADSEDEMTERERLIDLIERPAYLEFRIVHVDNERLVQENLLGPGVAPPGYKLINLDGRPYYQRDSDYEGPTGQDLKDQIREFARVDNRHVLFMQKDNVELVEVYRPVYVERIPQLTGETVSSAFARYDTRNFGYEISLEFRAEGKERFRKITTDYSPGGEKQHPMSDRGPQFRRRLAIIMDDTLLSAPNLNEPIPGGVASISGNFSFEEARTLAASLDSGALPAPIRIESEQLVDPTLGEDSIRQGVNAAIYGLLAVVIFMFVYYMLAGVVVNMALVLDAILMPLGMYLAAGFLGIFGEGGGSGAGNVNQLPTLTLYGIAGLVLTIGMAVDANVLIFERLREEQATGKRLLSSVQSAFEKAFSTIFDANITTMLVAVILFIQGSGPIRGFAVMLTAGILVSMYTALVFTRMGFDMITLSKLEKVKMLSLLPSNLNLNILGKDKIAIGISAVLLVMSIGTFVIKGEKALGIDFTGGSAIRYSLTLPEGQTEGPSEEEIRELLSQAGVSESVIQYQKILIDGNTTSEGQTLQIRIDREYVDMVETAMADAYGETYSLNRVGLDSIGPQVGGEMRERGVKAILFALIGIVIYITVRFEFAFAIGTIAALAHDVIITLGIYFLLGNQLSLPIVAALLTIVGYSANDTIVVFDRIREDLKLLKGKPYREIANLSINQTLSRTLLTSMTTLFTIVMLLIFGGGAIFDFALALFIGVLVGTYSSTFVATPVMLLWHKGDKAA